MNSSNQEEKGKKKVTEVKTYPVPYDLEEIKENITVNTNTSSTPSKDQIINQAFNLHSQGNISEAAKLYQYCINQGFNDHRVFSNYGTILRDLGKLQEAEISYRKAIEIKPDYSMANYNLGLILKDIGKLQEAEISTRKAIELNPDFAMAHSNLGLILKDIGKLQEAEISTRKAIELKPDYSMAHYNLGLILKDIDKLQEAEISTRKAIEIKPDYAEAYSNLGNILKDIGKLQEAEMSYRKAIEIKPDYSMANYNLGNILNDLGKLEEAEFSYRKAIEINPDYANAHLNLGNTLKNLGKLQEAEFSYRKAIEINPDFAMAHSNLGGILVEYKKLEEAEKSLNKALDLNPQNESIKNHLINLLTIYKPKKIESNLLYMINEEFKEVNLFHKENILITDNEAIRIYKDGLKIYKKYNLNLETNLSQIYRRNEVNLNCKRHKLIFNQHKVIPEFCFGCYKVQVEVVSIIELMKLFLVFNQLKLKNNNTRKSIIELRPNISGFYKGLIYCLSLTEALKISKKLNINIQNNIRIDLISKVKRGCSEYPLVFPQYKEISTSGDQPMNYNENWRTIEKEIDQGSKNWGKSSKSIEGFNLNNFLIMRNWVAYAQKIRDESVIKITNEQIKGPKFFQNLNREFHS
ncbi:tetratricopeptide repeat protein [Prochlorococcus marinus]|uniref:tetratricopeptide repeat protein n=1 Tax=Prochlorococcus marinus TaxID=1219 RepID=UPI0022B4D80F|nr:tetratricopeptide repeat protein [Prochlorococcus marinus]